MPNKNEKKGFEALYLDFPPIRGYVEHKGFKAKVNKAIADQAEEIEGFEDIELKFVPDGFYISKGNRCIYVIEIINTNMMDAEKKKKLMIAWSDMDYYHWELRIIMIDNNLTIHKMGINQLIFDKSDFS